MAAVHKSKLAPDELFSLTFLRSADLSSVNQHVAYVVSRTDSEERFETWIERLGGDTGRRRIPYDGNTNGAAWSPDGRNIAIIADGRLRVAEYPSLGISEPLTPKTLIARGMPVWAPDGDRVAISLFEPDSSAYPLRITDTYFRADGLGYIGCCRQRIYEIRISTGEIRCLTPQAGIWSQPQWSPCGKWILCICADDVTQFSPTRLVVLSSDGSEVIELLDRCWAVASPRWAGENGRVVVAAAKNSPLLAPALSLVVVDRASESVELRTQKLSGHVGLHIQHDMPAWDLTQDNMMAVCDRNFSYATVQRGGRVEIWRVGLEGDIVEERIITGDRSAIVLGACSKMNTLLFAVSSLESPTELFSSDLNGGHETCITDLNDSVLEQWPKTVTEQISVTAVDGVTTDAWLMAPSRSKRRLPTILFIHGGPHNSVGYAFRYDLMLLATQGYGVAFANFRGSMGYGEEFARAIVGDWGARAYPDHMGVVDAVVSRHFSDERRIGVWGHSHGGFAVCWLVGHTHRFKAAVAEASVTNFSTLYYLSDIPNALLRDLGGLPHEIPDVYRARSPITYAHRCKTPTLLIHGEADLRAPIGESEQFFRTLQDVKCKVEMLRLQDCSHMGDSDGPLSARLAQNQALVRWFGENL